jgi:hypothetical protein
MIRRRVLVEQSLGSVTIDAVDCASVAYPASEAVVVEGECGPLAAGASVPLVFGLMEKHGYMSRVESWFATLDFQPSTDKGVEAGRQ